MKPSFQDQTYIVNHKDLFFLPTLPFLPTKWEIGFGRVPAMGSTIFMEELIM